MDIFTYMSKLRNTKTIAEPDGVIIVMLSGMVNRAVTLVHHKGVWNSSGRDTHDLVFGYFEHHQYFPTQVGKYLKSIPHKCSNPHLLYLTFPHMF